MTMTLRRPLALAVLLAGLWAASAHAVPYWGDRDSQPAEVAATALKPGQWVWSPAAAPQGPVR